MGKLPGVDCVATVDDSLYHALRSGPDAIRYVGIGDSALGRNARRLNVRNLRLMPLPEVYGNSPKQVIPLSGRGFRVLAPSHPVEEPKTKSPSFSWPSPNLNQPIMVLAVEPCSAGLNLVKAN